MSLFIPGQVINVGEGKYTAAEGCYELNGRILASTCGKCHINRENNTIRIIPQSKNKAAQLQIGSYVIAKVLRIKEEQALVKIMIVDDVPTNQNIEGIIRKQDIRQTNLDILKMQECFIPGDIVKAKFISYGDSQKIYLSVNEDELGVIFAKHQESQQIMLPYSWQEMICISTGQKELRKVAKPNISIFQQQ